MFFYVIPEDDGGLDYWIAGLLGLSSRKTLEAGFQGKNQNRRFGFFPFPI
jgi:hypothetical protein